MNKAKTVSLLVIGALLVFNGLINIVDNGGVLAYDITSILAGIGFAIASRTK